MQSTVQLRSRLERPQRNAQGARMERILTFVLVDTDAGLTGIGEAFGDDALMEPFIEKRVAPMVTGMDSTNIPARWQKMFASHAYWEIGGAVLCAINAVEVACHDIWGQAEGVPVSVLLGGAKRDWIKAYARDPHWEGAQRMARTAASYVHARAHQ